MMRTKIFFILYSLLMSCVFLMACNDDDSDPLPIPETQPIKFSHLMNLNQIV